MPLLTGRGRDELVGADGSVGRGRWTSNVVTRAGLDLLAHLLVGAPARPIGWLALGRGEPGWDQAPPGPDPARTVLTDEVFRAPVRAGAGELDFDAASRTITARVVVPAGIATGELREVGLVAGTASARRDSGVLLNHRVHDVIDKGPGDELGRVVELRLGDGVDDELASVLGGLLVRGADAGALVGVAIGTGTGPAEPGRIAIEQLRRSFAPGEVRYDADTATIVVAVRFDADDVGPGWPLEDGAPVPARELGLLVGTDLLSALVVGRAVIPPHDLRLARPLEHRYRLALGDRFDVEVPT